MSTRPDVQARHRQRRRDSRRRILDAALQLLEDRPWSEISLGEIMRGAELSRTAFYRHFDDRQLLLLALMEDVGMRLEDLPIAWGNAEEDPIGGLRRALGELTAIYARHGRLLGAIAEAAGEDAEVRAVYLGLADRLVAIAAERIAADVAAGRSRVADPQEVARVLIWANEAYLQDQFGRAPLGDPQRAAAALAEVWIPTVYGGGELR
jgi:AcrR family transcriptional regulator